MLSALLLYQKPPTSADSRSLATKTFQYLFHDSSWELGCTDPLFSQPSTIPPGFPLPRGGRSTLAVGARGPETSMLNLTPEPENLGMAFNACAGAWERRVRDTPTYPVAVPSLGAVQGRALCTRRDLRKAAVDHGAPQPSGKPLVSIMNPHSPDRHCWRSTVNAHTLLGSRVPHTPACAVRSSLGCGDGHDLSCSPHLQPTRHPPAPPSTPPLPVRVLPGGTVHSMTLAPLFTW